MKKITSCIGTLLVLLSSTSHAGLISSNFDDANGLTTFGSALVTNGVGQLTESTSSQRGSIVFDQSDNGVAITGFTADFDFTLSNSQNGGADGISFGLFDTAQGLAFNASIEEEGANTGLSIAFDTYLNSGLDISANAVSLHYNGVTLSQVDVTNSLFQFDQGSTFQVDMSFLNGLLDLDISTGNSSLALFSGYAVSNWQAISGQFFYAGRTGGAFNKQVIDNVNIQTQVVSAPAMFSVFAFGLLVMASRKFFATSN